MSGTRRSRGTRPSPAELVGTSAEVAIHDPAVHVVVELIGGTTAARGVVLAALAAGKHVVTANKALLAAHGPEVFEAARRAERVVCFEAAVAGGVPIIRALAESLAANQVTALQGILNGTSNYILTAMADRGVGYAAALAEAQHARLRRGRPDARRGRQRRGPQARRAGADRLRRRAAKPGDIEQVGIDGVQAIDIRFAAELGYTIKLLAEAWTAGREVALHVAPVLLRRTDMLAQVRGAHNAIQVTGDVVGETLYQGPGAGMMPTASSVVSDILDLAVGRAQRTFAAAKLWSASPRGFTLTPSEKVRSRFYLRLSVADQPGVLAEVCRLLAAESISIASVIQHEPAEGATSAGVPLVIMTHAAETGRFRAAARAIGGLPSVAEPPVYYSVAG